MHFIYQKGERNLQHMFASCNSNLHYFSIILGHMQLIYIVNGYHVIEPNVQALVVFCLMIDIDIFICKTLNDCIS